MEQITSYVRSNNSKKVMVLTGTRQSFRCRQRNKLMNGERAPPFKFVSFKEMQREIKKGNAEKMNGVFIYDTLGRL